MARAAPRASIATSLPSTEVQRLSHHGPRPVSNGFRTSKVNWATTLDCVLKVAADQHRTRPNYCISLECSLKCRPGARSSRYVTKCHNFSFFGGNDSYRIYNQGLKVVHAKSKRTPKRFSRMIAPVSLDPAHWTF